MHNGTDVISNTDGECVHMKKWGADGGSGIVLIRYPLQEVA